MKQNFTYQDKIDELKVDFNHPNNRNLIFIFVEGKSDLIFYKNIFNTSCCKVESFENGINYVLKACDDLTLHHPNKIIGIIDADFNHLDNKKIENKQVFMTDFHDLEMMFIFDNHKFNKITQFYLLNNTSVLIIKNEIFISLQQISLLKWLNVTKGIGYKFEHLSVVEKNQIKDFEDYFNLLNLRSKSLSNTYTLDEIKDFISQLNYSTLDFYQLTNGHDFFDALAAFLRKNGHTKDLKSEELFRNFALHFSVSDFKNTQLCKSIVSWAKEYNITENQLLAQA